MGALQEAALAALSGVVEAIQVAPEPLSIIIAAFGRHGACWPSFWTL